MHTAIYVGEIDSICLKWLTPGFIKRVPIGRKITVNGKIHRCAYMECIDYWEKPAWPFIPFAPFHMHQPTDVDSQRAGAGLTQVRSWVHSCETEGQGLRCPSPNPKSPPERMESPTVLHDIIMVECLRAESYRSATNTVITHLYYIEY